MTGFLQSHGTSACIGGFFLPFDSFEERDETTNAKNWASVEELAIYDPFEQDRSREDDGDTDLYGVWEVELDNTGRADLMESPYWNFYVDDHHVDIWDWSCGLPCDEEELERMTDEDMVVTLEHELVAADYYLPAFSTNLEPLRRLTLWEEDDQWYRRNVSRCHHNGGRKLSKWHTGCGRNHRDTRDRRHSIRLNS